MAHPWRLIAIRRLLAVALSVGVPASALARAETSPVAAVNAADGIALKGYDAVELKDAALVHSRATRGVLLKGEPASFVASEILPVALFALVAGAVALAYRRPID